MVSNKKAPLEWPRTAQVVGPLWEWAPCRYPGCRYNLSGNQILQHFEVGSVEGQTLLTWRIYAMKNVHYAVPEGKGSFPSTREEIPTLWQVVLQALSAGKSSPCFDQPRHISRSISL